jgi:1-acyl-sn-glycerol-3-phosphate acyltransferase
MKLNKYLLLPLKFIYSIYALIVFVAIMLLIFPFAVIASARGKIKGGNMILLLCRIWADTWFPLVFIYQKRMYEAPHDKSRPYIFVSNHISYIDAPIIASVFRQPLRPLGKVESSRIPIFGYIYKNAIVTVDRSSAINRAESVRILKSVLSKGISVLVFPEGTFNMGITPLKDFFDGAFRIAIETQTPIKPVIILDAYRRLPFESLFLLSPGISRSVYLEEIPVAGYTLDDIGRLKQEVYSIMEKKMMDYKVAWKTSPW